MPDIFENRTMALEKISLPDEQWDEFVASQTHHLFQESSWGRILKQGYKAEVVCYVLKQDKQILLGLPGIIFDFKLFRIFYANTPYGGFVGDLDFRISFLELLEKEAQKSYIHQIRIAEPQDKYYSLPETYRFYQSCLHLLDLKEINEEILWAEYKKNIRRDIRRAVKSGIRLKQIETPEDIDAYYRLYQKTMKRNRAFGPHPRSLYHVIFREMTPQKKAVFLVAEYEGEFISGVILLLGEETTYLLGNVSDPQYLNLCPNDFIIHESILYALKNSSRFFDFMTTNDPYIGEGKLSAFKEKWGASRSPFTIYEKNLNPGRAFLWDFMWKMANTSFCSSLLRLVLNR